MRELNQTAGLRRAQRLHEQLTGRGATRRRQQRPAVKQYGINRQQPQVFGSFSAAALLVIGPYGPPAKDAK